MKYNISKGEFSSGIHVGVHFGRVSQTYKVRFDSSCMYDDTQDWERDWNKLVGWSYSNVPYYYEEEEKWQSPHHRESVRFVWRANKKLGVIEIAFYYYQDGVRHIEEFTTLKPDVTYILGISLKDKKAILTCVEKDDASSNEDTNHLKQHIVTVPLPRAFKAIWSYKLFPFFGGTFPAWNDMTVEVTET